MLHTANNVIKHKAGLLNLAEQLKMCRKLAKISPMWLTSESESREALTSPP